MDNRFPRRGDNSLPERITMLCTLMDDAEAHIDELREHLEMIRYKISFYQALVDEQHLFQASVQESLA